jgi:hypothetical protein
MSFESWLGAVPPEKLAAWASEYARGLAADGLTVFKADLDKFVPITPSLTPEVIGDDELARLSSDARLLLQAAVKAARWTLGRPEGDVLYEGFTPLERACLEPVRLARIATARVDFFRSARGAMALELNATIPAMQGYSDLIAHRWLRLVARERGVSAEQVIEKNGSNTKDLLASIVAHYRDLGGAQEHPSILIVSRRGDSQLGELRHYERAFPALGHRTMHCFADEIDVDAAGHLGARGERFDLLYRHVFARRVEEGTTLAKLLVDPGKNIILNPVVSPLEVKGLLAIMQERGELLADDEREAVQRAVPWTRLCRPGPSTTPDGERVADLARWARANPARLVVKRSWDYGGKGVHIGPDEADWPALIDRAAADPNLWVLQELVPPHPVRHLLVEAAGPTWREVFVDLNAYANLGVAPRPTGGVCRASGSKIVNIASGGGVAPFIRRSVMELLFPA